MQIKMTGALVLMLLGACAAAAQTGTENNTEVANPAAVTAREALDALLMGPVWLDGGESRTPVQLREVLRQPLVRREDVMKLRSLTPEERLRMREQLRNPLPQANLK